jgi:ketol-acid reductoisomerase
MKLTEKQKAYEKELLEIIEDRKIMFFSHAFAYASFSPATAYNHGLEKLDTIKEALARNRASGVTYMLNKWIGSDNATLQIAAMRIIADEEIRRSLNQQYIEQTIKEQPLFNIDVKETSDSKSDK